jgi:hypothetical protein
MEEHMSCTAAKSTEETKANRQNSKWWDVDRSKKALSHFSTWTISLIDTVGWSDLTQNKQKARSAKTMNRKCLIHPISERNAFHVHAVDERWSIFQQAAEPKSPDHLTCSFQKEQCSSRNWVVHPTNTRFTANFSSTRMFQSVIHTSQHCISRELSNGVFRALHRAFKPLRKYGNPCSCPVQLFKWQLLYISLMLHFLLHDIDFSQYA